MASSETPSQSDHDARFRHEVREAFDVDVIEASSEEDKLGLLISIQSFSFHFIKDASRRPPADSEAVQQGLDVLWHMFREAAKALEKDDAIQDKLISLLLWTKEFDSLHRSLHSTKTVTTSWEKYGFADSLQALWNQLLTAGTASKQCNLAEFSAKVLTVGIYRDEIAVTALWYLREALETDDEAKAFALLPAAVVWIENCRHTLLAFSATDQSYGTHSKPHLLAPGALARRAGVEEQGFSMNRWLFWRRRLQDLSHNADSAIAKEAKKGFMAMIFCGRDLDYEVPGEMKFTEKLQAAMGEELVRSGKESVDGEDIDINVDWVD
ncbi:uncharacterized protein BDZ99DRAFT_465256 [Mytilinidion resinicola]|uniref:Uncharacterized protein n=1 Tax=Mytilinidion resinicola TaxID=574789 RepID=A0A6A6YFH9_9PEZI|nr:uncharacterized protein BDZ99DRAFT_465256 [Mytilinidion resinicola]KAF2807349.1 hypothetical protein BDZ99DRAFT_465256 [Mytilinidion resinicola]